jgi:peptidoglycan/LPS O-acetylase OafA/YrhL
MPDNRIKDLDFLRGLAIIGVLLRHSAFQNIFARAGWAGVDLFFVLSGFLVSGLLFREYKKTGAVRIGRFLIRRGFKIYPTFYIFLIVSFVYNWLTATGNCNYGGILSEVFFLQSYLPGCFIHTWSLAIEEHFYILLSIFILISVKKGWIKNPKLMIAALSGSVIAVILLRIQYIFLQDDINSVQIFYTHLRMDGLLLGVIISFFYHFNESFVAFTKKHIIILIGLAIILISPLYYMQVGGLFMNAIGFNFIHAGFGIFVALAASGKLLEKLNSFSFSMYVISITSWIGIYSYSIYVWHLLLSNILERTGILPTGGFVYLAVTIILGILLSMLIEQTFLRIRDRYFA